jgi:glycosyltransferase involved in cell wall biosynthesis
MPALEIGMPVFNGERYVEQAIDSILKQSFTDFVIRVSDNASTDGTQSICERVCASDPRAHYERQDRNLGAAANYNRLLAPSRARYFKWAAHDDLLHPDFLARCIDALESGPPDLALVYPRGSVIDENGHFVRDCRDELDARMPRASDRFASVVAIAHHVDNPNSVFGVYRRDALIRTRGHGNFVSADDVLRAEIALEGQVWRLPERLFQRRIHADCMSEIDMTPRERAAWFDPENASRPFVFPRARYRIENLRAISRSALSPIEKFRCLRSYGNIVVRRRVESGAVGPPG